MAGEYRHADSPPLRRRVLSADSPTRPRREKHLYRGTRLRGGRGGPVRGHPPPTLRLGPQNSLECCPPAPCRCWTAAAVWSGPRAAKPA